MIRFIQVVFFLLVYTTAANAQVNELEEFKKELTVSVFFESGRIDTIAKSEANTLRLRKRAHDAFLKFVMHPNSNNLDSLKSKAKNKGSVYWYNVYSYNFYSNKYYFDQFRNNPEVQNPVHQITFSGLYNLGQPDFISMFIEEFNIRGRQYAVHYYNSSKNGMYYIKDVAENIIVFENNLFSPGAPVYRIDALDEHHLLLIEDLQHRGQRAIVLNTDGDVWTITDAFRGKGFVNDDENYDSKIFREKRTYLKLASTKTLGTSYGMGFAVNNRLSFDKSTLTLSYKTVKSDATNDEVPVSSVWKNNMFVIDDYYVGEKLQTIEVYPDVD